MKTLGISLAALLAGLAAAQAADLPTKKSPPPPPAVSCFSSLYSYFDSTPADCPLHIRALHGLRRCRLRRWLRDTWNSLQLRLPYRR